MRRKNSRIIEGKDPGGAGILSLGHKKQIAKSQNREKSNPRIARVACTSTYSDPVIIVVHLQRENV